MGKYVQPNGRQASPIFPQMPKVQQRTGSQKPQAERKPLFQEERPKETPVMQDTPKAQKQTVSVEASPVKKKMTVNDLRNGFKMSVIIGEPVSRKYRKNK